MKPKVIISGGQAGADLGGLIAAKRLGINTGGWAPRGWITELGPNPELGSVYNLTEHETSYDYAPRTEANVALADAVVLFGKRSRGSNLTERLCDLKDTPLLWLKLRADVKPDMLLKSAVCSGRFRIFLGRYQPTILMVAGNRESVSPGIEWAVERFIVKALSDEY